MQVYTIPEIRQQGRIVGVEAKSLPKYHEEKYYWVGSHKVKEGYERGAQAILEELKQDEAHHKSEGTPLYLHHYLSEAGLDMIQDAELDIELGYYASQGLTWWPNDLDKRRINAAVGKGQDKRILWNANVIAILQTVPDVSKYGIPPLLFPIIVKTIKAVAGHGVFALAELLVSVIEAGMDNERVYIFTEVLLDNLV